MTQLELPPISLARYLDLLKRRRWHVIPISVLGLLVGAAFAFFVPRFYVANTTITCNGSIIGTQGGEDPMEELVGDAELGIPQQTPEVLRVLGWKEWFVDGWDERRTYEQGVRGRIKVYDLGPKRRGRTSANLQITYKDTDRERADRFLTTLRDRWIEQNHKKLEDRANREDKDLAERMRGVVEALEAADLDLRNYERANGLNPLDWALGNDKQSSALTQRRDANRKELDKVSNELAGKVRLLERKTADLALLKPTRTRTETGTGASPVLQEEAARLMLKIGYYQRALQGITPAHKDYPAFQDALAETAASLEIVRKAIEEWRGAQSEQTEPNPAYVSLRSEMDELQFDIDLLKSRQTTLEAEIEADDDLINRMPELYAGYRTKLDLVESLRETRKTLENQGRQLESKRHEFGFARAFEILSPVWVPPRPTDPNITLLALAGSAIGLAVAIGLILLLDILQSNFKTLADVEHGLPVPVLGGLSHMVTREDQARAVARRTRVGLVASVFLLLMLSVVTIYYVAPTRLPTVVRDVLGVLLGTPP